MFKTAIERIGVPKERILHVAQSLYHDIAPANALGFDTVWIDRHDGHGSGATVASDATPKWTLRNLRELVEALSSRKTQAARAPIVLGSISTVSSSGLSALVGNSSGGSAAAFSSSQPATMSSRKAADVRHGFQARGHAEIDTIDIRLHRQVQRDRMRRNRYREVTAHLRAVQIHRARDGPRTFEITTLTIGAMKSASAQSFCPQRCGRHHRRRVPARADRPAAARPYRRPRLCRPSSTP